MKKKPKYISVKIDKLTNSIQNVRSGDSFPTNILLLTNSDTSFITKRNGWLFDWRAEFNLPDIEVYKLTIVNSPAIIQGLISLSFKPDHVYINLIESAPFNKGKEKVYAGIPGNLVAFACKLSFQRGCEGYVAFISKTQLINHYEKTLGAVNVGGQLMVLNTEASLKLISIYFKD